MKKHRVTNSKNIFEEDEIVKKFTISSDVIVPSKDKHKYVPPGFTKLEEVISDRASAIEDNKRMLELLPDIQMVKNILTPAILSPKDLSSYKFALKSTIQSGANGGELLDNIETHFKTVYDLESKLTDILDEALFDVGSYSLMVLPENSIIDIINNSKDTTMENISTKLKAFSCNKDSLLSRGKVKKELLLEITDDSNILMTNRLKRKMLSNIINNNLSMESYKSVRTDKEGGHFDVGADAKFKDLPNYSINTSSATLGSDKNPYVMKISAESIIPVHSPTDPRDHLGYYILLNDDGIPIVNVKGVNAMDSLNIQIQKAAKDNSLGGLINSTGFTLDPKSKKLDNDLIIKEYSERVILELEEQLKNGVYGKDVQVSNAGDVYSLMLSRVLSNQNTKVLYVPVEIMTYFAFKYNEKGIGISLLEATKLFGSLRAILLFATVMAGVKSAVGRTKLDITLDDDDEDPSATIEAVIHYFTSMQSDSLPLNSLSAGDIVRSLQKASVDVNIQGGEGFPTTSTELSENNKDYVTPDTDVIEVLRRMQYNGFGVPPEIVDSAMEGDLATVVVSRNQLFAKHVLGYAKTLEKFVSKFVRSYIRSSSQLCDLIEKAKVGVDLNEYINSIEFTLPYPDLARIKSQSEALDEYSDAVDTAVEFYITEDMFAELMNGDLNSGSIDALRLAYANMLKRDWMTTQNILPEIGANLSNGTASDSIKEFNKAVMDTLKDIIIPMMKDEKKLQEKIDKTLEPEVEEDESANSEDGDTGGDVEEDSGDDTEVEPVDDASDDGAAVDGAGTDDVEAPVDDGAATENTPADGGADNADDEFGSVGGDL